jgi:hypothetical protein
MIVTSFLDGIDAEQRFNRCTVQGLVDGHTILKRKAPSPRMDWVLMPLPDLLRIYAGCVFESVAVSTASAPLPEKALRLML